MLPHEFITAPINVTGGTTVGVPVFASRRGTIKKLRVVQLSGTLEGFTYTLYNTIAACQADGSALSTVTLPSGVVVTVYEKLYRVTPALTVASAAAEYASTEGYPEDGVSNLELPYEIKDGADGSPLTGTSTGKAPHLQLKLVVGGTGAKVFGIAMTILDPFI